MKTYTTLLQLIRSLTTTEKRYFSIYARQQGTASKQYLKLYQALEAWPHAAFDEAAFKRQHRGKGFVPNLSTHKRNLYDTLLRMLRIYRASQNPELELAGLMQDIQLLIDKGIYTAALENTIEAIALADTYEMFAERMQLNAHLRILLSHPGLPVPYTLHEIEVSDASQLYNLQLMMQAANCNSHLVQYLQLSASQRQRTHIKLHVQQAQHLYSQPNCPMRVQLKCFNALGMYYQQTGEHTAMYHLCQEWMDRCHHSPHPIMNDMNRLMRLYRNYLTTCIYLEKWDDMPPVLQYLAELQPQEEHLRWQQLDFLLHCNLFYELNNPARVNALKRKRWFDKTMQQLQPYLHPVKVGHYLFNIATLMQQHRQWNYSRQYYQQFLTQAATQPALQELYVMALILQWVNLFSLEDSDAADKHLRSTCQYLKKEKLNEQVPGQLAQHFALAQKNGKDALRHLSLNAETTPAPWGQLVGMLSHWLSPGL